ncbi:MAG: hypothetical protein IJ772_05485 [Bacilli bacterium]|nr:hypothetical protein [Bacilli bacterium]
MEQIPNILSHNINPIENRKPESLYNLLEGDLIEKELDIVRNLGIETLKKKDISIMDKMRVIIDSIKRKIENCEMYINHDINFGILNFIPQTYGPHYIEFCEIIEKRIRSKINKIKEELETIINTYYKESKEVLENRNLESEEKLRDLFKSCPIPLY